MKKYHLILSLLLFGSMYSCIGDDFVQDNRDTELSIINPIDTIAINTDYQFEHRYLNNIGLEEDIEILWTSSDPSLIQISDNGVASSMMLGSATIFLESANSALNLIDSIKVVVGQNTTLTQNQSFEGTIATTSSYALSGDFLLEETDTGIRISFDDNYNASTALPGLYVYLSNNKSSVANALEIGMVQVFNGVHNYEIPDVGFNEYQYIVYFCKPFNVKVGDGEIN